MKLYGTNFSSGAVAPDFALADYWADFVASLGMNAVRLLWGYRHFVEKDPAKFLYFIHALKQRGIKLVLPARVTPPTSFTDSAVIADELRWIDWLYGMNNPWTQTTVGQEVVLAEIANETSVWKVMKPANWSSLSMADKKLAAQAAAQIEADWFGIMEARLRQHIPSSAIVIGSQSNYQFQSNTRDGCDHHLYFNQQRPSGSGPWEFDNTNCLDKGDCYPITQMYNRKPGKPHGVTEYNDTGPSPHYHTNLLLIIYAAWLQGCDWLFHYQMAQHPLRSPGVILGNTRDDEHLGKLEILKLGSKLFFSAPPAVNLLGYDDADYFDRIAATGWIDPMNHHKSDPLFNYWGPFDGRVKAVTDPTKRGLRVEIPGGIVVESYKKVRITEAGVTREFGRFENSDMVWTGANTWSSWGNGPAVFL